MKILHVGQMIGGLDIYIRNSIVYAESGYEYVIVHGDKDNNKPIEKYGREDVYKRQLLIFFAWHSGFVQ